jgi:multidrug transporter EmrE-like cation transporter
MQTTVIYTFLYAACNVCGATLIKLQLKQVKLAIWQEWLGFMLNVQFVIGAAFIVSSALALFKALSGSQFSFVIPLATGMNFLMTVAVGYYLFNDRLSTSSYIGFVLIMAGVILISLNSQTQA